MAAGVADYTYAFPIDATDNGIRVTGTATAGGRVVFLDPSDLGKVSVTQETLNSSGTFAGTVSGVEVSGTYQTDAAPVTTSGNRQSLDVYRSIMTFEGDVTATGPGIFETGTLDGTLRGDMNFRTARSSGQIDFTVDTASVTRDFSETFSGRTINFNSGYEAPNASLASISGRAWDDLDGDGIEETGEPGFRNLTVQLWSTTDFQVGNGDDQLAETFVTDNNGYYSFINLLAGNYFLRTELPDGRGYSRAFASFDSTKDNDFLPVNMRTEIYVLTDGTSRKTDIDAGISPPKLPWHNYDLPWDVSGDGNVFNDDVIILVNELNRTEGGGQLPPPSGGKPPPYYDVSPNDRLEPLDVVVVVNELNRRANGEGESRMAVTSAPTPSPTPSSSFLAPPQVDQAFTELQESWASIRRRARRLL